jgi:UDP-glucose 4-epimerase
MDRKVEVVEEAERLRPDASEVMRLVSDSSQLRALTGWQPQHTLDDGLRTTIRWFTDEDNLARYKVDLFNL